ncbi:MAG: hypothetical protein WD061_02965, partial [Candidatus Saccharimonadales bacterium]
QREVTVDTTNKTLRIHDGTTLGGTKLAAYDAWGRLQVADPVNDSDVANKGYVDTVPTNNIGNSGSALEINLTNGRYQTFTVSEALALTTIGWPASGTGAYVTLEVSMGTEFAVTWPAAIKWHDGGDGTTAPALAVNTRTLVVLFSRDNGTTIEGSYGQGRSTA